MKKPKLNKKKFEELREMFKADFQKLGAVLVRDEPYYEKIIKLIGLDFELETSAGKLKIHPGEYDINCKFVDVEAAKKLLPHGWNDRLNPFSGKYNFCWYPEITTHDHVRMFISTLMNDGLIHINKDLLK